MYNNQTQGYNSDEDTEDASESEMPRYEYEFSSPINHQHFHPAVATVAAAHHHHHHHHQQQQHLHHHHHHHFTQQHPNNHNASHQHNAINSKNLSLNHLSNHNGGQTGSQQHQLSNNNSGNNFTELREQMYMDKLNNLREQLYQLDAGIHPEFLKQLKRVETQRQDRILFNETFQLHEIERIEREYINEKKAALREFEDRKIELRESLILELEDRRRMIENERSTMELLSDCADTKPVTTRKLRRRPNEPVPVPDKRRRTSPAQLNHQLEDKDINEDLKALQSKSNSKTSKNSGGDK